MVKSESLEKCFLQTLLYDEKVLCSKTSATYSQLELLGSCSRGGLNSILENSSVFFFFFVSAELPLY